MSTDKLMTTRDFDWINLRKKKKANKSADVGRLMMITKKTKYCDEEKKENKMKEETGIYNIDHIVCSQH